MAKKHDNIANQIIMDLSGKGWNLWYLVTGSGWVGKARKYPHAARVSVDKGDVIVRQGQFLKFGMQQGATDLIGYQVVEITEDMVGMKLPVFLAADVKTGSDRLTPEQTLFLEKLSRDDCITAEVRDTHTKEEIKKKLTF